VPGKPGRVFVITIGGDDIPRFFRRTQPSGSLPIPAGPAGRAAGFQPLRNRFAVTSVFALEVPLLIRLNPADK